MTVSFGRSKPNSSISASAKTGRWSSRRFASPAGVNSKQSSGSAVKSVGSCAAIVHNWADPGSSVRLL